jgi:predicted branched-subunit amino acid permease
MPFRIQHPAYLAGIKDSSPTWFGVAAWGLVVGVAMTNAGLSFWQALGMTLIVFAGSAQLAALPLIAAQAPLWVIFVTAIVVNLRFLIFSAIVAPRFAHLSALRRVYLGFFTGDVTVALFTQKYPSMATNVSEQHEQTAYLHGLVIPNWLAWQIGTIIGIVLGSQIPTSWSLGFAGTLAILCVMLPLIMNKPALLGIIVAGVVAIFLHAFPYKLGLLIAVLVGMVSSMVFEEVLERRHMLNKAEPGESDE